MVWVGMVMVDEGMMMDGGRRRGRSGRAALGLGLAATVMVMMAVGVAGAGVNKGEWGAPSPRLSGVIIPGFASSRLRAWAMLDCPYSPLDFRPLDLVWLDTKKVNALFFHVDEFGFGEFWFSNQASSFTSNCTRLVVLDLGCTRTPSFLNLSGLSHCVLFLGGHHEVNAQFHVDFGSGEVSVQQASSSTSNCTRLGVLGSWLHPFI